MSEASNAVRSVFESQLTRRGIGYLALEDGRYELTTDAGQMTIALDNLTRQYARDGDVGAVGRFIDSVLASCSPLPDWQNAKKNVFSMIESAALEIGEDTISKPLSHESILVLAHFNESAGTIRYLSETDAEHWGVALDEIWESAEASLDGIMQSAKVSFLDASGIVLGVIGVHEPHKASLIRAPSLRQKVERELGWPIYAVARVRIPDQPVRERSTRSTRRSGDRRVRDRRVSDLDGGLGNRRFRDQGHRSISH